MSTSSIGLILSVAGIAFFSLMLAIWACVRLSQQRKQFNTLMELLRSELDVMSQSSMGVGQRLVEVERRLNSTMEKQQRLEGREGGGAAITQAAKLMEMGASVDDVMTNCQIGRPEAELIALLHKEVRSPSAPRKRIRG
ncbi:DUF2802 domain-containing protein [Pokkaliibacter sp. CJK22405]|uniref:DUF2802 domain-containing protein n=1 Tax=Pokkaliibacter sp. CJK22405 TaxID=3384615 RepID=UPI003984BA02